MNSLSTSFDSIKQNRNIEECDYEFEDIPQQPKQQNNNQKKNNNKKKNNKNKNNNSYQKKNENIKSILNDLDAFFSDEPDETTEPQKKEQSKQIQNNNSQEQRGTNNPSQKRDDTQPKKDNKQIPSKNNNLQQEKKDSKPPQNSRPSPEEMQRREKMRQERERRLRLEEEQRRNRDKNFEERKKAEIEREKRYMEENPHIAEKIEEEAKVEDKKDVSENNKSQINAFPKKEDKLQHKALQKTDEEGKYKVVAEEAEIVENMNLILFNKKIVSEIRDKIREEGIDVIPLPEENNLPIIRVIKNPKITMSRLFGQPATFIVTAYKNDGHTERIYLDILDAPLYLDKNEADKNIDVKRILQDAVRKEQLQGNEDYMISIVLSKNSNAEPIKDVRKNELKELFSIDGVLAGLYIDPETKKKKIETKNEFPPSIIRHSYQYCNDILNGTAEACSGGLGGYFRRQLKINTSREAEVLEAEITYVAQKQKLDVNLKILDALEHFHFQRRGENDF